MNMWESYPFRVKSYQNEEGVRTYYAYREVDVLINLRLAMPNSPMGQGATALAAIADLCRQLDKPVMSEPLTQAE